MANREIRKSPRREKPSVFSPEERDRALGLHRGGLQFTVGIGGGGAGTETDGSGLFTRASSRSTGEAPSVQTPSTEGRSETAKQTGGKPETSSTGGKVMTGRDIESGGARIGGRGVIMTGGEHGDIKISNGAVEITPAEHQTAGQNERGTSGRTDHGPQTGTRPVEVHRPDEGVVVTNSIARSVTINGRRVL